MRSVCLARAQSDGQGHATPLYLHHRQQFPLFLSSTYNLSHNLSGLTNEESLHVVDCPEITAVMWKCTAVFSEGRRKVTYGIQGRREY